jgi:hypothetical protein
VETFGENLQAPGGKQSITIHNNYNSNVVAYIGQNGVPAHGGKNGVLPAIRTTRKELTSQNLLDLEESPVILDGAKYRKQPASKHSSRSNNNLQNIQQSLSLAKDAFSETAKLQEKINYQGYQIQNYKVEVY